MKVPRLFLCAALATTCLTSSQAGGQTGHIGPSNSAIAGGIAGITAGMAGIAVAVGVVHSHHVLSGCVVNGSNGPELKTSDAKTWSLEGNSANIKPGDRVKVHGARSGHKKTASGAEVFTVDKVVKDYGVCETPPSKAAGGD